METVIGNLKPTGNKKGGDIMKEKDKERLYADLYKYCDQIGILPEETPLLFLTEMSIMVYESLLVVGE
jgi:hypothetical protein